MRPATLSAVLASTALVSTALVSAALAQTPAPRPHNVVLFIADGSNRTRVELEHRRLDRYGARRDEMRRIYDTEGDWGKLLEAFARAAETE